MPKTKVFKHVDGLIDGNGLDIFEFGDLGLKVEDLPQLEYHSYPELNQYKYTKTKSACTIVGAYIDACYLYDIKPTDNDMLECVEFAHTECNYQFGKGWFADLGMRAVEKFFEKKYNKKLYYSTITWDNPDFWKLLKKGYMVGCTFKGNYQLCKDYQADNILDGTKFGTSTFGHRTSIIYKDNKIRVVDSAAGNSYNIYEVKDISGLIQNGVYGDTFFVYTKESNVDPKEISRCVQLRNTIKVLDTNTTKAISLTRDSMFQLDLKDAQAKYMEKTRNIDLAIKNENTMLV